MGQKVHPIAFRLGVNRPWNAKWFARGNYSDLLREDIEVRKFLTVKLRDAGLASIDIERSTNGVIIGISTSRPGMVIGRGGTGVEQLKKQIARIIGKGKRKVDVKVNIQEVQNPDQNAQVVATLSIIFNHSRHTLAQQLTSLQHEDHHAIMCSQHVHLDHDRCLEVIVLRGTAASLRRVADAIISTRGVQAGELTLMSLNV